MPVVLRKGRAAAKLVLPGPRSCETWASVVGKHQVGLVPKGLSKLLVCPEVGSDKRTLRPDISVVL